MNEPDYRQLVAQLRQQLDTCFGEDEFRSFAIAWARFFVLASDLNEVIVAWAQVRRWAAFQDNFPS